MSQQKSHCWIHYSTIQSMKICQTKQTVLSQQHMTLNMTHIVQVWYPQQILDSACFYQHLLWFPIVVPHDLNVEVLSGYTHLNKPMLWYYSIPMYKRSWSYNIYQKIDNLQQKQKWYMWCVFGFRSFKRLIFIFIFILYYIYIILIFILLLIFIVIACLDWQVMHFNM